MYSLVVHIAFAENTDYVDIPTAFEKAHELFGRVPKLSAYLSRCFEAVGVGHNLDAEDVDDPPEYAADHQGR